MGKRWYVVHAFSGFEKQVQRSMAERITRAGMEDKFCEILVPTEEVVEMKLSDVVNHIRGNRGSEVRL